MSVDPKRVQAVFLESVEQSTAAGRAAVLDRECGGDVELRRRIEVLLQAHDRPDSSLGQPATDTGLTGDVAPGQWLDRGNLPETPPEGVGSRIKQYNKHYKLLQQIGEGGMGVVFMAEQQEPVRRMVALKVIKAGMDSAQVIGRFEAERQALALMDHPNIAKVLDAGTTASGRPYFVMELVKGIPITKYCDEQRLSPRQRLELFVPVCQAIQHAHQKGIIHRDIKPSNVLIAAYDGKPVPKVIDFGVAKATGGKLTEHTLFTGFGSLVGTFEYMSPEQAEFNALDIDTRADVYSLGVLLYELLTGNTPLSRPRLKDTALTEVLRLIREEEPPRPSTRLSESKETLASVSEQRHMEPAALVKAVRGEVDWIVMKALEKDRTRRYETANGLARDIQRYLAEEAVEAGPPSARYRLRKLAWKHRHGLATAAALLLLLVAGVVVSACLTVWALRAEGQAHEQAAAAEMARQQEEQQRREAVAQHQEADKQKRAAEAAKLKAEQSEKQHRNVLDFFQNKVLAAVRSKVQVDSLEQMATLRAAMDAVEPLIEQTFAGQPEGEVSIRNTLGLTYYGLGEYASAIKQHERALVLSEAKFGADHTTTLGTRANLGVAYQANGRYLDAIRLCEQNLQLSEVKLGPDHIYTLNCRNNLAEACHAAGRFADAVSLSEKNQHLSEAKLGADNDYTRSFRHQLAQRYLSAGRKADGIRLHEQILKQREAKFGAGHPGAIESRLCLALAYQSVGRIPDAIRLSEQNLHLSEAKLGTGHVHTLSSRNHLADMYLAGDRIADALRISEQNLQLYEAQFGAGHPHTLDCRNQLAKRYLAANRSADAIRTYGKNLQLAEANFAADHPYALHCRDNLAEAYRVAGRIPDAFRLSEQNLHLHESKFGAGHPHTLACRETLAQRYFSAGRRNDSLRLREQNLEFATAKLGTDHPHALSCRTNLIEAYQVAGRRADAIRLGEQNLKMMETKLGPEHPSTLGCRGSLAEDYDRAGQFAKSEALNRVALEQTRKLYGSEHMATAIQLDRLGLNLLHQHKYAEAEPLLRENLKIREAKLPDDWATFDGRSMLGEALMGQKKYSDAEPLLLKGYEGMKQRQAQIPPQAKIRLTEELERLVRLYEATGNKDKAGKWRKELRLRKPADKK